MNRVHKIGKIGGGCGGSVYGGARLRLSVLVGTDRGKNNLRVRLVHEQGIETTYFPTSPEFSLVFSLNPNRKIQSFDIM